MKPLMDANSENPLEASIARLRAQAKAQREKAASVAAATEKKLRELA